MPPKKKPRPDAAELTAWLDSVDARLLAAVHARRENAGRAAQRRLTAAEYENALRDLLDLPELKVRELLPTDGTRHGFDKISDGLEISYAHLQQYYQAAEWALEQAIATLPKAPAPFRERLFPAERLKGWLSSGAAVMLEGQRLSSAFDLPKPSNPEENRMVTRELEAKGIYKLPHSVGMLCTHKGFGGPRPNLRFAAVHPGRYKVRMSIWGFWWEKGEVTSKGRSETLILDKTRTVLGFGAETIGYFDAPALTPKEHEVSTFLRNGDIVFFEGATVQTLGDFRNGKDGVRGFSGPGVAVDWIEIEGPIHEQWPPQSHKILFGDLPLVPFDPASGLTPPEHRVMGQIHSKSQLGPSTNSLPKEERNPVLHTVYSGAPVEDARKLLADFLPRAFRGPVDPREVDRYVGLVRERLEKKDCFELAMRHAYMAALTSTDFLLHQHEPRRLTESDLASRLAFWLWNSPPDEALLSAAQRGTLRQSEILHAQIERMLADPRSERFVHDFLDQWLNLRAIDDTVPDRQMYPEFDRYLRDSMLTESRTFFREILDQDLPATHSIAAPFGMLNQRMAEHYGIDGVIGSDFRRVSLPQGLMRGGFLTQASVLKVTANGTTTSPVVRGVFTTERLLGFPVPPPPPNVPAIEPDTRGATTVRELLEKHRVEGCASCHVKLDPPGLALESFDVIGGLRDRYRSTEKGDGVRKAMANGRQIKYLASRTVDSRGETAEGQAFSDLDQLRALWMARPDRIARAWVTQLIAYATGAETDFADRAEVDRIVSDCQNKGYGVRSLIHRIAQSSLFQNK
jgi:hypothetical protein